MAFEEPEIGRTDPIGNKCMDDELHFGMPGGSGHYKDQGDECDERVAIPTTSQ